MAKYLKIKVWPDGYSHAGLERFEFVEVDDDFDPDNDRGHDDTLWRYIDEAVSNYVASDYEILEGDFGEDEDY